MSVRRATEHTAARFLLAIALATLLVPGCRPTPRDRIARYVGRRARLYVNSDPADPTSREWLEDTRLVRLVQRDGEDWVELRYEGMRSAPDDRSKDMDLGPFPLRRILTIEIDGKTVYTREP